MTAVLVLALLRAEPSVSDLEAQLRSFETNRPAIEEGRARAWTLRLSAGAGYLLTAASVLWALVEQVRLTAAPAAPLGGLPYPAPVPPLAMVVVACVLASISVALHVSARALDERLNKEEGDLDEAERPVRRQLAEARDEAP